VTTLRKERDSL